ncbi:MAG: EscU/YscU/HrcU family type III secretion system export apparatus switch protein [Oscillospiraceae bacterium]|nr:EscU/YscU/HrcU family type III secretion system export apparatus switch protein [Oscillospiraceae bacterium]
MAENNKTEQVVALKYDKSYKAPRVVAKGKGYLAEQILSVAEQHDVLIHTDKTLAENLNKLDLGEDIPQELFEIVAKVYSFIDKIDVIMAETKEKRTKNN